MPNGGHRDAMLQEQRRQHGGIIRLLLHRRACLAGVKKDLGELSAMREETAGGAVTVPAVLE
jgi:hypothetical protein